MADLPSGTVTFLFTDIEGSTALWEHQPQLMRDALARHDNLVRDCIESHGGYVFRTVGDAFYATFPTAPQALYAALATQRGLASTVWGDIGPIKVRMALHTGAVELRDGEYLGLPLNRVSRILSAGHGGQMLLSLATQQLVRDYLPENVSLRDLGEGGLRGLIRREHIYQLVAPDLPTEFPPLTSLDPDYLEPVGESGRPTRNPYKGLRPFTETDAGDFFGREDLIRRLGDRLAEDVTLRRFLVVVGPSGSGKSSVVRAGLVSALRRGLLPGSERWQIASIVPGARPMEEVEAALLRMTPEPPPSLLEQLESDERGLIRAAKRLLPGDDSELLLVVDQFEEVFTLVPDEPARVHFLESLHKAVIDPRARVRVVCTLRADFYDRPLLYPDPGELVRQRTEVVLPLSNDELCQAITGPAGRVGVGLEPELIARIVRDVEEQPGALPLLQYALTELFERRRGDTLTLRGYRESGGVAGALTRRAEELVEGLTQDERSLVRQVFLRLMTLGEGQEDTRRRVTLGELRSLGDERTVDEVLELFGGARLLTFDRDAATGEGTAEVAHEALIQRWPRLREWVEASREDLRLERRLGAEAGEWERAGRDPSYLARGSHLAQYEGLAEGGDLTLSLNEREFLAAGVAERERGRTAAGRRVRVAIGTLSVALLAISTLALVALNQARSAARERDEAATERNRAVHLQRLAASRELAFVSRDKLETDPELGLLLAVEARRTGNTNEAQGVLRQALLRFASPTGVLRSGGWVTAAHLSPDGRRVLTVGGDGNAAIWELSTGKPVLRRIGNHAFVNDATLSPDGRRVVTAGSDGAVRISDAGTGNLVRELRGTSSAVHSVRYSPDGRLLVTAADDGAIRVWTADTGEKVSELTERGGRASEAAFGPGGKQVMRIGEDDTVRVSDVSTGRTVRKLDVPGVTTMSMSPDGKLIATVGTESDVRLWDARTSRQLRRIGGDRDPLSMLLKHPVVDVNFSPDSARLVTASTDRTARLWDVKTGKVLLLLGGHRDAVISAEFSHDGRQVVTGSPDGTAQVWDARNLSTPLTWNPAPIPPGPYDDHSPGVSSANFSPDGRWVVTGTDDGSARVWDANTARHVFTLSGHQVWAGARYSPDGSLILVHSNSPEGESTNKVWDAKTGRLVGELKGHSGPVAWSASFSRDSNLIVTAGADRTARIWTSHGRLLRNLQHDAEVSVASFNPAGSLVVTVDAGRTAYIWDTATGKRLLELKGGAVFSPDGSRILTLPVGQPSEVRDVGTGKLLFRLEDEDSTVMPDTGVFSTDGKLIATSTVDGASDSNLAVWDSSNGKQIFRSSGALAPMPTVFSPDSRLLATPNGNAVRVLDARTGEVTAELGHRDEVYAANFSLDGKRLVTASQDGTARIYPSEMYESTEGLLALAAARASRQLTPEERAQYLHE